MASRPSSGRSVRLRKSSFKSAIWAFDSKNKVSKKQSESDAELQVEDFVAVAADKYVADSAPN